MSRVRSPEPHVHRRVGSVLCVACAVSWATWLLFTAVLARCTVLCVLCPGPLGSCPPMCWFGALCRVCGVLGPLAPVHLCACSVRCVAWFCRVCGVPGHLAPVHQCARSVCCVACAVSLAIWLLFTDVLTRALRYVCGVLSLLAPAHRCACSVRCLACAVSWATWLLFTGVLARCFVLRVRCPGPVGSCSPVCLLRGFCCVRGVLGHFAPVHRCARLVLCAACAVSWATWLVHIQHRANRQRENG